MCSAVLPIAAGMNGVTFVHNLLSMTGDPLKQPFVSFEQNATAIFNGEVAEERYFGTKALLSE